MDQLAVIVNEPHADSLVYPSQALEPLHFPRELAFDFPPSTQVVNVFIDCLSHGEVVATAIAVIDVPTSGFGSADFTCTPTKRDAGDDMRTRSDMRQELDDLAQRDLSASADLSAPLDLAGADLLTPPFVVSTPIGSIGSPISLAVADFNSDGRPDVAWANEQGTTSASIGVALNTGGSLRASTTLTGLNQPTAIIAVDVDHDGKIDLVGISTGAEGTYLSKGNGTFAAAIPTNAQQAGSEQAVGGDFNGDGYGDIAVTINTEPPVVQVFTGSANGTFLGGGSYVLPSAASRVAAGDIDGDGLPDLVVGLAGALQPLFHTKSNMSGSLFALGAEISLPEDDVGLGIAAGDVNGDGKVDTLASGTSLFVYGGTGTQTPSAVVASPSFGSYSIAIADFDGDGKLDVALSDIDNDRVEIYRNTGAFAFVPWQTMSVGKTPFAIATADFDGDGKPDLVAANYGDGTLSLLLNRSH